MQQVQPSQWGALLAAQRLSVGAPVAGAPAPQQPAINAQLALALMAMIVQRGQQNKG